MVQWYTNVPVFCSFTEAEAPGAIEPVANAPLSAVELCVEVSLFIHVTVVPAATVIGLGEYAVVVRVRAPATIEIVAVGLGDGLEGLELLPLHAANPVIAIAST